jgi:type I restriction enzyme S subunit
VTTTAPWTEVRLGDHVIVQREGVAPEAIRSGTTYVGLEHIAPDGSVPAPQVVAAGDLASQKFRFSDCHVLYGKLRPNLGKVAAPDFKGVCSTDILPLRPAKGLDKRYLWRWLRQPRVVAESTRLAAGANLPRISPDSLIEMRIPLPPIEEQHRIAAVLDQADELRAKRRAALALLDTLTESVFLDMFGDPVTNPMDWPDVALGEIVSMPLRNGVSPASAGATTEQVLTLSAITRGRYDPQARKESTFAAVPPANKRVDASDMLICRGNGNPELVGRGHFPTQSMPEVVFPDTMIAARIPATRMDHAFVERFWACAAVRNQIQSVARTTNGTFKVNQTALESVRLLDPPLVLQERFGERIAGVSRLAGWQQASLAELDALFAALQHRAFRGEL